jgi:hypothetical protein
MLVKEVYFDAGLQGWIKNTARREHWRMAKWYELSDLIQDGFLCYCKCRDKYTRGPPEPGFQALNTEHPTDAQRRHFMNLVQRAYFNHIMTLSSRFAAASEEPVSQLATGDDEVATLESLLPPQSEEASLLMALKQAPAEISDAIRRLINDGLDGGEYLRSRLRERDGRVTRGRRALRETTSAYLARVLGDPDLSKRTMAYLLS